MIQFPEVQGAIFDLDDTLLDNGPADRPDLWLHSRSRIAAVHEVAERRGIEELLAVTPEENGRAFTTASVHSLDGAIWNIFFMKGLAPSNEIDTSSPLFSLMSEIAGRKNELHEDIIREFGVEVPGATNFVKTLATKGLLKHLALATSSIRRDIHIFLDKYDLNGCFPPERIISQENVAHPKPDPECFDLAFRSLRLPDSARRNVLAFEDNPRGVASAKAAGLLVCAITTRLAADDEQLFAAKPDLVANSYQEFGALLGVPGY